MHVLQPTLAWSEERLHREVKFTVSGSGTETVRKDIGKVLHRAGDTMNTTL
jgi:hypothetical protein